MKISAFLLLLVSWLLTMPARSQSVSVLKFPQLEQRLSHSNDTLYVVHFWATWCGPCVEELPQFETTRQEYADKPVKVVLVSMDDRKRLQSTVLPFVRKKKLKSEVVLLDETDLNTWVDKLTPEWSGALPMTLIFNRKQNVRRFIGDPLKAGELQQIVHQLTQ